MDVGGTALEPHKNEAFSKSAVSHTWHTHDSIIRMIELKDNF